MLTRCWFAQSNKQASTSHISLDMSPASPAFGSRAALPPRYVDTSDEVSRILDGVQVKSGSRNCYHVVFTNVRDSCITRQASRPSCFGFVCGQVATRTRD